MTNDKDMQLAEAYPKIFRRADMKATGTCWGIECGDGWFFLINQLCAAIQAHLDTVTQVRAHKKELNEIIIQAKAGNFAPFLYHYETFADEWKEERRQSIVTEDLYEVEEVPQLVAIQVKEKFGSLSFYSQGGDDYTDAITHFTERLSYHTCEFCGSTKNVSHSTSWISTACEECIESEPVLKGRTWKC